MQCSEVDERDVAEAYLLGRLSEADRDAYETHYFECARCYSELQALRDVSDSLRATPRETGVRPGSFGYGRSGRSAARPWVWAAMAATLILATSALAWVAFRPGARAQAPTVATAPTAPPPAVDRIAELAIVTAPPYEARQFRNAAPREAFTSGMARYTSGDYAGAIPWLVRAVSADPAAEDARFYLGASQLLSGDAVAALTTLKPIADRAESPYAEEARFLCAKAHLRRRDLRAAGVELDRTIALHGAREQEAVLIREQIRR